MIATKLLLCTIALFTTSIETCFAQNKQSVYLTIQDMLILADKNSKSINTFDISKHEAQHAVDIVKNARLPNIDLSLSASYLPDARISDRNFSNVIKAPMPHFGNNFALEASQILYAGGSISNSIAKAKLEYQIAELNLEDNRQEVRFLLIANYLELFKLYKQKDVYIQNIKQSKLLLEEISAKEKEGILLHNDITRYSLQVKTLELQLTIIENNILINSYNICKVLGINSNSKIEVDSTLINELPACNNKEFWQEKANNNSIALQLSKINIERQKKEEKIIRSNMLPTIALFAGDKLDGPITIEVPPINSNLNYYYIGLSLKYNISSIYKTKKNIKLANLSIQKAVTNQSLIADNVEQKVNSSYIRFEESYQILDTQIKSLELAEQNYDIINNRYLNNLVLITEMLDASNSKLMAQIKVANAKTNVLFNYFSLIRVCSKL